MFRDTKSSPMSELVVGVGSVIGSGVEGDISRRWLIVSIAPNKVVLINNKTFTCDSNVIDVQDENYLSSSETRALCTRISDKLQWTFTDFFISTKGMKNVGFTNLDPQ